MISTILQYGKEMADIIANTIFHKELLSRHVNQVGQKLLKWSYDGHLLEYGQMAQVSRPIGLLLQIKISKKKVTNEPR